jgi:hypothetical protein
MYVYIHIYTDYLYKTITMPPITTLSITSYYYAIFLCQHVDIFELLLPFSVHGWFSCRRRTKGLFLLLSSTGDISPLDSF